MAALRVLGYALCRPFRTVCSHLSAWSASCSHPTLVHHPTHIINTLHASRSSLCGSKSSTLLAYIGHYPLPPVSNSTKPSMPSFPFKKTRRDKRSSYLANVSDSYQPLREHSRQPQPHSRRRRMFGEELCRWYDSCSSRGRSMRRHTTSSVAGRGMQPPPLPSGDHAQHNLARSPSRNSDQQDPVDASSSRVQTVRSRSGSVSSASQRAQPAATVSLRSEQQERERPREVRRQRRSMIGSAQGPIVIIEGNLYAGARSSDAATPRSEDSIIFGEAGDAARDAPKKEDACHNSAVSRYCRASHRSVNHDSSIQLFLKCRVQVKDTKNKALWVYDRAGIAIANARDIKIYNFAAVNITARDCYNIQILDVKDTARATVDAGQNCEKVLISRAEFLEAIEKEKLTTKVNICDTDQGAPKKKEIPKRYRLNTERRAQGCYHKGDVAVRLFTQSLEGLSLFQAFHKSERRQDSGCFEFVGMGEGPGPVVTARDKDPLGWVPMHTVWSRHPDNTTPVDGDAGPAPWVVRVQNPIEPASTTARPRPLCPYGSDHSLMIDHSRVRPRTSLDEPPFPVWLLDLLNMAESTGE